MKPTLLLPTLLPSLTAAQYQRPLYSTYNFNPLEHLAGIAPYFEPSSPPRDPSPPQGCTVTRAAYLVRHAAITANDFDYETYLSPFISKLSNTTVNWSTIPVLSFLSTWTPPSSLPEQEQLTRVGKHEASQLAVGISFRYGGASNPSFRMPPQRVWAATAERTTASAEGFIRGLETADNTVNLVAVPEGKKQGADSLTPYSSCDAYESDAGSEQEEQYIDAYTAPVMARLNALAPAFNFTADDVTAMQELCGYETVIRGSSPFCSTELFTPDEWLQFEYGQDLHYHYNVGYGSDVSGAIGFPWVNATMGLLAADQADQDLYVSFTHRELPPTVAVALGLFNNSALTGASDVNATMPTDQVNYNRAWRSSHILPFLSNIAIEKMNCSANYGYAATTMAGNESSNATADPTFYRVLVNQSPQVLPACQDGPAQSCSADGMQTFLNGRAGVVGSYSTTCENSYSNSTDVVSFYTSTNNGTVVGKRRR